MIANIYSMPGAALLTAGCALLTAMLLGPAVPCVQATTISVNDPSDVAVNLTDTAVTLRDAINAAENDLQVAPGGPVGSGADIIDFDVTLTAGGDASIDLTIFDTGLDNGELGPTAFRITTPITITGPAGDAGITIQRVGSSPFRLFHVTSTGNLTLENLIVSGGLAQGGHSLTAGGAGGGGGAGVGGAIVNEGSLSVERCTLSQNQAIGGSGGAGGTIGSSGGTGGGGTGGNAPAATTTAFGPGGGPNGGSSNSAAGGNGGGGAGGNADIAVDAMGSPGGAGGFLGGGGAGGSGFGSGATPAAAVRVEREGSAVAAAAVGGRARPAGRRVVAVEVRPDSVAGLAPPAR
jgi:hypothetical protein